MNRIIYFLCILIIASINLSGCGISEEYKKQTYEKLRTEKMPDRLKPYFTQADTKILDLVNLDIPNTVGILNGKGEIALLRFDEKLKTKSEIIVPGFPGYYGVLASDPEHNVMWLRRGSGNYFIDVKTRKTGHCISMGLSSKVNQVILADPDNLVFAILYGVVGSAIDLYDLKADKKIPEVLGIRGSIWNFYDGKILMYSCDNHDNYDYELTDIGFQKFIATKDHELTKKLTEANVELSKDSRPYNLRNRVMIGYVMNPDADVVIRWDEEQKNVSILPFTKVQIPSDIEGINNAKTFSSDGRWYDVTAKLNFNGMTSEEERFIYNIGPYPIGVSPPIRLGYISENTPGAFMMHDTWGPCYVVLDEKNPDKLWIFKLSEGLEIINKKPNPVKQD